MTPRSIQKNILEVLVYGSSDEIVNAGDSGSLERNDAAGTKCRKKKHRPSSQPPDHQLCKGPRGKRRGNAQRSEHNPDRL